MELFSLLGKIAIDNGEANNNIDKTTEKAENFGSKLGSGIKTAAAWGTAIVGGTTAAVGGMMKFAESTASTADHIDKMSQKIGVSRQAYQELDFICSQSGTSVDSLQAGMKSLTAAMDGCANGTDANVEQFERLGVSVQNADGSFRSQEDVLFDTLSALQGIEDQTEKSRLATELFGKSGTELMPLLNGASGSIEEMKKQAQDLGLVLSDDLIDNGVELTDSLDQTKRAFSSIVTQLGGSLMPLVTKVSDYVQKSLPYIQQLMSRLEPILTQLFDALLPPLMDLCEQLFPPLMDLIESLIPPITEIVQAILPIIVQLIQILLPPIVQIVQMVLPILVQLIQSLLPILQPIIELLQPIIDLLMVLLAPLLDLISLIIPPLTELLTGIAETISAVLQPIIEGITETVGKFADAFGEAKEFISGKMSDMKASIEEHGGGIKGVLGAAGESIKSNWSNAFSKMNEATGGKLGDMLGSVKEKFGDIKGSIKEKIEGARDVVKNAIEKIKGFFKFKVEFPKIKLPHFSISGSANPLKWADEGTPKISVDWYKKAMNDPMIMNEPTAFGINSNGQIMAGGEAGSEVVSGTDTLMNMIGDTIDSRNISIINILEQILQIIVSIKNNNGDIVIPVYIGNEMIDEMIVKSKERTNFRSGGFVNV